MFSFLKCLFSKNARRNKIIYDFIRKNHGSTFIKCGGYRGTYYESIFHDQYKYTFCSPSFNDVMIWVSSIKEGDDTSITIQSGASQEYRSGIWDEQIDEIVAYMKKHLDNKETVHDKAEKEEAEKQNKLEISIMKVMKKI